MFHFSASAIKLVRNELKADESLRERTDTSVPGQFYGFELVCFWVGLANAFTC